MLETAVVFDERGHLLLWHEPENRSGGSLPDSESLWEFLWRMRDRVGGVAHTHPWVGMAMPSGTDMTTWAAIERGLGRRLIWPIITLNDAAFFRHFPRDGQAQFQAVAWEHRYATHWMNIMIELRRRSDQ